jgi:hypothetical protein
MLTVVPEPPVLTLNRYKQEYFAAMHGALILQ